MISMMIILIIGLKGNNMKRSELKQMIREILDEEKASFGIATYYNQNYVGLDSFLQASDDALLKSKRCGRNRITISETKSMS